MLTTEIIKALNEILLNKQVVYLATVVNTWGSSPRPPGAMMLWSSLSGIIGSVSGGCIEEDLLRRIKQGEFANRQIHQLRYGANDNPSTLDNMQTMPVELPCGGVLQLLLERITPDPLQLQQWQTVLLHLQKREGVSRLINLTNGEWQWQCSAPHALDTSAHHIKMYLGPTRKLLIVGANQISWHLAHFADTLDFAVTVCDPNEDLSTQWRNAGFTFIRAYPDGLVEREFADENCAVVCVSHDPRLDDMALLEALPLKAFYIGAMGSQRTSNARLQRLRELEIPEPLLAKLHAPIGLDICSKTPAEIAISIASHLVQCYQRPLP